LGCETSGGEIECVDGGGGAPYFPAESPDNCVGTTSFSEFAGILRLCPNGFDMIFLDMTRQELPIYLYLLYQSNYSELAFDMFFIFIKSNVD